MKLLSIITINYNNAAGLAKTLESVVNQTFKDFEYIVIDGGSTDESVDTIRHFKEHITYWVSEKDNGIYPAMNKGIGKASGEYLFFLNSGDYLVNNSALDHVLPFLHTDDIIYGNLLIEGNLKTLKQYPDNLWFSHFFYESLPHSGGSFFRREGFTSALSGYDENLKIVSDWKWYLQAIFKFNYSYKHIPEAWAVFDGTGISSINGDKSEKEKKEVMLKEFPAFYAEISELMGFKRSYQGLAGSRFLKIYLRFKRLLHFGQRAK